MSEHEAVRSEEPPSALSVEPLYKQIPMTCTSVIEQADGSRIADCMSGPDCLDGTLLIRLDADEEAPRRVMVEIAEEPLPESDIAPLISFSTPTDLFDKRYPRSMEYGHPENRIVRLRFDLNIARPVPRVVYVRVEPRVVEEEGS